MGELLGVRASATDPDVSVDGKRYYAITLPLVVEVDAPPTSVGDMMMLSEELCRRLEGNGFRVLPDATINTRLLALRRGRKKK